MQKVTATLSKQISLFTGGGVDIITGGFPCQPFSNAGFRKGSKDERYLWPEMLRAIKEVQPAWVVGENVTNLIELENGQTFERICVDLEHEGYEVQPYIIPAASIGAEYVRNRVWILANNSSIRVQGNKQGQIHRQPNIQTVKNGRGFQEVGELPDAFEPFFSGASNGIPTKLYNEVLKALGNSVVPQVVYEIFKAIEQYETTKAD